MKAQKFKMLDPKKIPRFLITIFTYTLFLYMAFTGAKMLPILVFLPPLAFALFVLTTMLSIIRNLGSIGWLYQPIADFFENKIGMKIKEVLKLDIDNVSNYNLDEEFIKKQESIRNSYVKMGIIPSFSCIPYEIFDLPEKDTQVSFYYLSL